MSSARNTEYLFVYGTLRKVIDHPMSDLLQEYSREVGRGTFQGRLFDAGSFPAAKTSDNESDIVHGDLFKIENGDFVFQHLDPYEGYSSKHPSKSLFLRKSVSVRLSNKNPVNSWIYLYNRPVVGLTLIPNGDYLKYLKNRHQDS
jgi:gamma-glutamylcyclotransferase (GGCT)/AIG2-like uncharacterized protein YtfP